MLSNTSPDNEFLEKLRARVLDLELASKTINEQLLRFRVTYVKRIGEKLISLDELNETYARLLYEVYPANPSIEEDLRKKQKNTKKTKEEYRQFITKSEKPPFIPSEELKNLYRHVAKKVHPDLATDGTSKSLLEDWMRRANEAYSDGNIAGLKGILEEYDSRRETIGTSEPHQQISKARIAIANLEKRITELEAEIESKTSSDTYRLMIKVEVAKNEGKDLLSEMENIIDLQIKMLSQKIDGLKEQPNGR